MRHVSLLLTLLVAAPAAANPVTNDSVTGMDSPAAVTCGFCATERYGVIFRQISSTQGLLPSDFPLTINRVDLAVAAARVVDGGLLYECQGSATAGRRTVSIWGYTGVTPPTGDIRSFGTGAWPGETALWIEPIMSEVELSTATEDGGNRYDVTVSQVAVSPAVRVDPPNTYIRIVVEIPAGGSSTYCVENSWGEPGILPIRDDSGRIGPNVNFLYSIGGAEMGWHWSEEIPIDPTTLQGLEGDWVVRLDISPAGTTTTDAGTTNEDAGMTTQIDAGSTTQMDAGPRTDAGAAAMCTADEQCAGGERCIEGRCRRLACTAASDCTGGMTCVEGMCRNLCTSNAECLGGEVCDMAAGHCVPVGMDDGGCGCRGAGAGSPRSALWLLGAVFALVLARRKR
jgi:MYXO-CTERM domain-containing protein